MLKKKYRHNVPLLFTESDSLMYEVCPDDLYQDVWAMRVHFDLASYPKGNRLYDSTNNLVAAMWKMCRSGTRD